MTSKNTNLVVRLPKALKSNYEAECERRGRIPSEVTRSLVRDFTHGRPTIRRMLENNNARFQAILERLGDIEKRNE